MKVPHRLPARRRAAAGALVALVLAGSAAATAGPAGARWRAWQAERDETRAAQLLRGGQVDAARAALRQALQRDPRRREARRLLGQLELERRRVEQAFLEFQALAELHPDDPAGWRGLAQAWLAAGMPLGAETAASRAIDRVAASAAPDAAPDYLLRARIRSLLGRRHAAALDLRRARELAPHDAAARALELPAPRAPGPGARPPRERFWPGRLAGFTQAVTEALRRGDGAAAQAQVDAAAREFPDSMFAPWLAGVVAATQGRLDDAERQLQLALAHAPRSSRVVTLLAHVWARRDGALRAGERLLELHAADPGFRVPLDIAATAFLEARLPARAAEAVARGVREGAPAEAFFLQADFHRGMDTLAEALAANAHGRERHPQDAALALQQAELQLASGDRAAARASLEAQLQIRPDALAPRLLLARMLADEAPRSAAARALARGLAQDALEEAAAQDALGWLLLRGGEPAAALPWLAAAAAAEPAQPSIRYHHGLALLALGRRLAGREELAAAVASEAPFAERPEAQKRLRAS